MNRVWLLALIASAAHCDDAIAFGSGPALYGQYCAGCHGADGRPNVPDSPDFSLGDSLRRNDRDLIDSIRFGVRTMPGFGFQLSREEILDVLFHIRSLRR